MVKSYCVKQKKQTECVEPSGYKQAKNGRLMFFCTCAECGITKTKFVKSQSTSGSNVLSKPKVIMNSKPKVIMNSKPYCGINKVPKGKHLGTEIECIKQNQIRNYGLNKVDKKLLDNINFKPKDNHKRELNKMIKSIDKQIKQVKQGN